MNKIMKFSIIGVLSVVSLVAVLGGGAWYFLNATFIEFEKDYPEKVSFNELTIDGYTFLDRNSNGKLDVYEDERAPIAERVEDALSKMTTDEKIHLIKGSGLASAMGISQSETAIPGAVGTIVPTPRLGLPTIYLSDGPAGLRIEPTRSGEDRTFYATAFPIATALASTWNESLVEQVGQAMGDEALRYGIDVILGPGVNIHRHPLNGRNFEYFSEDPLLTGFMGAAIVNGIESNGVGTSVKHFVANNQETSRTLNDVMVSDRAMREIYLKGFEHVVNKAQPWTIMSSYNKVNGTYVAESRDLLTDILRGEWGFKGLVMSDWFGGHDAVAMINAGNDLIEPGTNLQWNALKEGAESGTLSMEAVDVSVSRILSLVLNSQKMKGFDYQNDPDLQAHAEITRQSAAEGMVLLKNEGVLPLTAGANVALIGTTSYEFIAGGTGSGDVNEAYTVSLQEGMLNNGFNLNAQAQAVYEDMKANQPEAFNQPKGIDAMFQPYHPPQMVVNQAEIESIADAADVAIVTIGRNAGEGGDRVEFNDFLLSAKERTLLEMTQAAFSARGKKTIVVLNVGGAVETASWKSIPDAILLAWQGGQEGGNSAADILSGKVNPSGKLPMTLPIQMADHRANDNFPLNGEPMTMESMAAQFFGMSSDKSPEEFVKNVDYTLYEEDVFVGYRHFDHAELDVSYPFGFGLSYSEFALSDLSLENNDGMLTARVVVTNVGEFTGKEVVQLYIGKTNSNIERPIRELKGFVKTSALASGESTVVTIDVPVAELSYWNETQHAWAIEEGQYTVYIGTSSRNLPLQATLEL